MDKKQGQFNMLADLFDTINNGQTVVAIKKQMLDDGMHTNRDKFSMLMAMLRDEDIIIVQDDVPSPNTIGYGLMCNIQCYVRDLGNDIDSPLTLMNIEECLVDHASPEDVLFSKGWFITAAPEDVSQWHPKVTSLARFIDMQILVKSGGGI